ncbi:MAG: pyruvate dehydrogenase (acetyl-transferring) E1 component subunit alpha [Betaproteobacteria bacterium]|nr:pyruvate dehydrogenase (acetyl-transferring) E1 component subunit alpha [Betaproteobacteria bacterium]
MTVAARFEIHYSQFVDPHGKVVAALPAFAKDPAALIPLYKAMVLMRTYDAKAIALQRTGQLGTYASMLGKEAVEAGVGAAMAKDDVFLCTYRENGVQIMRGLTVRELFLYWSGDERGSDFSVPRHDFPICITIGSQCLHAAGVGYAIKLRKQRRVAVCMFGDGATSKGDFYEGINAAGTWRLPVVFVVTNNQWAISVPRKTQTAAQTLAQKAVAAGFEGLQVDGNDVIAVHHATREALAKARSGGGPTLIEAVTYRLGDHTTADDASRYRPAEEVAEAWRREPVLRLRNYLSETKVWNKAQEEELLRQCNEQVQAAAQAYLDTPAPPVEQMFDHMYATLPAAYAAQRAAILAADHGADHAG